MNWSLIIIVIIILIFIIYTIATYILLNVLIKKINIAFSKSDEIFYSRFQQLKDLINNTRKYSDKEIELLEDLIIIKNVLYNNLDKQEKINLNEDLDKKLKEFFNVALLNEKLLAEENFKNIYEDFVNYKNQIENAVKYYNKSVHLYNTLIKTFPLNFMAKFLKYESIKSYDLIVEKPIEENIDEEDEEIE